MFDLVIIIRFVWFDKRDSNWISICGYIWTSWICNRNRAKKQPMIFREFCHVTNLSLWFVFSVELTFIEFLEFSAFELDFASSGMTNEEPVLVEIGCFGADGSGSFGGLSSSSTKVLEFSSTIITSHNAPRWPQMAWNEPSNDSFDLEIYLLVV